MGIQTEYKLVTFLNLTKPFFRRFRIRVYRTMFSFIFSWNCPRAVCALPILVLKNGILLWGWWERGTGLQRFVPSLCISWSKCNVCTALELCRDKVEATKIIYFFSSHTFHRIAQALFDFSSGFFSPRCGCPMVLKFCMHPWVTRAPPFSQPT